MEAERQKIFVMMSGGVDSSLATALLTEAGHDVTGVFMKNWSESIPEVIECTSQADADDARAVANQLGIPFYVWDFEDEYRARVFGPMIEAYRRGLTPNPDVNCNSEVKFKVFLERAIEAGAEKVATGHYARIVQNPKPKAQNLSLRGAESDEAISEIATPSARNDKAVDRSTIAQASNNPVYKLLTGRDKNKDQSYFLYRLTQQELVKTLFPIGEMSKTQVRKEAEKRGLATAGKKDSQGLCFVGQVAFKEVLKRYISPKQGKIVTTDGEEVGEHDGAWYVTIGQRSGLGIGGGTPYFVVDKDVENNVITVVRGMNHPLSYVDGLTFSDASWVVREPELPRSVEVLIRYRGTRIPAILSSLSVVEGVEEGLRQAQSIYNLMFDSPQKAVTPGQAVVLYSGEEVLGGGVISAAVSSNLAVNSAP